MVARRKASKGKTLMEVFAHETTPAIPLSADEAIALVRELDRSMDQCALCGRWNSRTRGHTPGCRLGVYLGRIETVA